MAKFRRADHDFVTWKGDHSPRHVHIYKNGRLIAKWDLDNGRLMEGKMTARIKKALDELKAEGKL